MVACPPCQCQFGVCSLTELKGLHDGGGGGDK